MERRFLPVLLLMGCVLANATVDVCAQSKKGQAESVPLHLFNSQGELVGPIEAPKLRLTPAEWRKRLTPDQFKILRRHGTEPAFCGTLLDNKKQGVYACAGCKLPLFSSNAKFNSGTGWPSFFQPIAGPNLVQKKDRSQKPVRIEIECARCEGHLGHVFDDGPQPTGLRFCLNSESLIFVDADKLATLADPAAKSANKSEPNASPK